MCESERGWENCEWMMLPSIPRLSPHPLCRACCILLCCHGVTIKEYAALLYKKKTKNAHRRVRAHAQTGSRDHTHTFALRHFGRKYYYTAKQRDKLHDCNTRDHSLTGLCDLLSRAATPAVSTYWENRSLYWDIHQSHHRGLPDAAVARQAIRYWKLT